ncbi:hypothetical protein E2C01_001506 [Portunus trituberculatus]|uniref:Uncharacterized protein n=1 Tax=Portunus trituberculatus TaxID=210409 RepID=A0A5B7CHG1_PORTR|nr:hypothetical protein [Portunus trituberculatus]
MLPPGQLVMHHDTKKFVQLKGDGGTTESWGGGTATEEVQTCITSLAVAVFHPVLLSPLM